MEILYTGNNIMLFTLQEGLLNAPVVFVSYGNTVGVPYRKGFFEQVIRPLRIPPRNNVSDPLSATIPNVTSFPQCTVIDVRFTSNAQGLEAAGKELSGYINDFYLESENEIVLIGHSKSAVCFANMTQWLRSKTHIIMLSPPFAGTMAGDNEEASELISSNLSRIESRFYEYLFSYRNVDRDISKDSYFLQNLNLSKLHLHNTVLITARCPENLHFYDLVNKWLCRINKIVDGDGIVPIASQSLPYGYYANRTYLLEATHASVLKISQPIIKKYINRLINSSTDC